MARIRTIKPETFTSESISSLSLAARWTFVGLWTHVDDEGRTRDNPKIIRGALWPNEDEVISSKDVEAHLNELEDASMICRYTVDGVRYLHIVNFHKHQKISHPTPSKLPMCPHPTHPGPKPPRTDDSGDSPEDSRGKPESSEILDPRARAQDARAQATHLRAHTQEVEVEVEVDEEQGEENPSSSPTPSAHADQETASASTPKRRKKPEPQRDDVDALCHRLAELMIANDCKPPTITDTWRTEARLLLDKDGRDFGKAMRLLEWCQQDSFWKANIHSLPTFREKYDQLRQRATAEWERDHPAATHRPSTTTRIVSQGVDLIRKMAAEDGVDLGTLIPVDFSQRRELTA